MMINLSWKEEKRQTNKMRSSQMYAIFDEITQNYLKITIETHYFKVKKQIIHTITFDECQKFQNSCRLRSASSTRSRSQNVIFRRGLNLMCVRIKMITVRN